MYTLEPLHPQNTHIWDTILVQCPDSNAFHSTTWCEALANSFKQLTPAYFLIKDCGTIIGGLPAFVFQPIPGIKMLHSMPWTLFGGVQLMAEASVDVDGLSWAVETHLEEFVKAHGLCETVFTLSPCGTKEYGERLIAADYQIYGENFTHLLKTHSDYNVLWTAYNKRVRGAVRKAEKAGVTVYDTESDGDFAAFYEIYLATEKRLGGTPKPFSLLSALFHSKLARLAIAKQSGLIIAGLLYLCFNRTVTLWRGASVPEFWEFRPNNALFDHIIRWACAEGYEWVDFGASPPDNHGLIAHKEQYRAKQTHFRSFIKIHSPIKRAVWEKSEPTLRQLYSWVQYTRSENM
jgi:predicted N-acyltransferase